MSLETSITQLADAIVLLALATERKGTLIGTPVTTASAIAEPCQSTPVEQTAPADPPTTKRKPGRPTGSKGKASESDVVKVADHIVNTLAEQVAQEQVDSDEDPDNPTLTAEDAKEIVQVVTHDTLRAQARHLVARGETDRLKKWLVDSFEVEAVSMIPEDRLEEALESLKQLL